MSALTVEQFLGDTAFPASARSLRECARIAFGHVIDAVHHPGSSPPVDWDVLEQALHASNARWSRIDVRTALVRLLHWLRPRVTVDLPHLPLLRVDVPAAPPVVVSDAEAAQAFTDLWDRWSQLLPMRIAGTSQEAASALMTTALLRGDVLSRAELQAWVDMPLRSLDTAVPARADVPRLLTEALTSLQAHHLHTRWPEAVSLEALSADVLADVERECAQLLSTSGRDSAIDQIVHLSQAWRRRCLPPLLTALDVSADRASPLQADSWNTFALGLPATGEVPAAGSRKTARGDGRAVVIAGRPNPAGVVPRLKSLATKLEGDRLARAGRRGTINRPEGAAAVAAALAEGDWCVLSQLILHWTHHLLERPATKIKATSIGRYLSALAHVVDAQGHYAAVTASDGAYDVDSDAWDTMLERVAHDRRDATTPKTFARLYDFSLRSYPVFATVDLEALEDTVISPRARAHHVDPVAFEYAMETLWGRAITREKQAALMGVLAYYAGLRRQEVRGLRCVDVVDDTALHLCVRSTPGRNLKTSNGRRDLPLRALLPAHWSERLSSWLRSARLHDIARDAAFLFALPSAPLDPPADSICQLVVAAVRAATGDPSLTFHSMRHTCATRGALRLVLHMVPALRAYPLAGLAHADFAPAAIDSWRSGWIDPVLARAATHDFHAFACLMGHASPGVTFTWYVHACDVIRRAYVGWALPHPSRALLQALLPGDAGPIRKRLERHRAQLASRLERPMEFPTAWAALASLMEPSAVATIRHEPNRLGRHPQPCVVPAVAIALRTTTAHVEAVADQLALPVSFVRAVATDLQRKREWRLPREGREAELFVRICAAAEDTPPTSGDRAGWRAWREGLVVRGTRRAWRGTAPVEAWMAALAPFMRASAAHGFLVVEVVQTRAQQSPCETAALRLRQQLARCGLHGQVRVRSAEDVGWGRPPSGDRDDPWVLARVCTPDTKLGHRHSCGLTRAFDAIAVALCHF